MRELRDSASRLHVVSRQPAQTAPSTHRPPQPGHHRLLMRPGRSVGTAPRRDGCGTYFPQPPMGQRSRCWVLVSSTCSPAISEALVVLPRPAAPRGVGVTASEQEARTGGLFLRAGCAYLGSKRAHGGRGKAWDTGQAVKPLGSLVPGNSPRGGTGSSCHLAPPSSTNSN